MPIVLWSSRPRRHGPTRTLGQVPAFALKWLMEFSCRVSSVEILSNARSNSIDAEIRQASGLGLPVELISADINSTSMPKAGIPGD